MTMEKHNQDGQTFKEWMKAVDRRIASVCGLSSMDLADICYWDMWNDDCPATEAANEALENEGFPF